MNIAVILNYCKYNQTIECCNRLLDSDMDKIIIVDNASPNESYATLVQKFKDNSNVNVVLSKKNSGYARGNNEGLKFIEDYYGMSSDNIIYIVNPDSAVDKENITDISTFIKGEKMVGMVTVNIDNTINNVWHHLKPFSAFFINFWSIRWILWKLGRREGGFYKKDIKSKYQKVDVVLGAFFGISQTIFKQIGYFDEGTFLYYEEEILYSKLKKIGLSNYVLNTSSFSHVGRGSTNLNKVSFKKINDSSRLYTLEKYYNVGKVYGAFFKLVNKVDNILLTLFRR